MLRKVFLILHMTNYLLRYVSYPEALNGQERGVSDSDDKDTLAVLISPPNG